MSRDADDDRDASLPSTNLVIEELGGVAVVRINRPAQRNSLSVETLRELEQAFDRLTQKEEIKAVVFTGTGDVFASGADIRELRALTAETAREFAARGQALFARIEGADLLTVAAVNGYCMGGGLDLALSCRVRVASPRAVFAHPGARLGIITGWGGTQRLPRTVGDALSLEMFLLARRVSCAEAFDIGLVDFVGEPALVVALEVAARATKSGR